MLVRREVIGTVGGMNESLFLFVEETEWSYRIKRKGWSIVYLPIVQIVHIGQQSVHKNPERSLPEKYRNYAWFYREVKNPSKGQILFLKLVFLLAALLRIGLWTWRTRSVTQRKQARRMRRGYWEVIRQLLSF